MDLILRLAVVLSLLAASRGYPSDSSAPLPKSNDDSSPPTDESELLNISDNMTVNIPESVSTDISDSLIPNIYNFESANTSDTASVNSSDSVTRNNSTPENSTSSLDNADCTCVPFYLCDDKEGDGVIDIAGSEENPKCQGPYDVCCKSVSPLPEINSSSSPPYLPLNSCGHRLLHDQALILTEVSESEAQYGEFPWMMALLQTEAEDKNVYLCGGSLIHPQVVLTGAHCVQGKSNLLIRAGEWDTQTENELYPTQDRNVSEVIVHENYNNKSLFNDIALLILESPIDLSVGDGLVGTICLPEENEDFDNRDCVASGWGKDVFGLEGKYSVILKKVDLPIVPRATCLEALRKTRLGPKFNLHSSFICAGGIPGKDTCKGDGGSPLVCPSKSDPKMYVQAGIVAWGISCGSESPATYVNVPAFVPWIKSQLQEHNISLT